MNKRQIIPCKNKFIKYTLHSDEENDTSDEEKFNEDIGEEDGIEYIEENNVVTAFNIREELEDGYFDKDGHFIWNKDNDIRDNWIDSINWKEIKTKTIEINTSTKVDDVKFNELESYKILLEYMEPNESINKTLKRLGNGKKLSSIERLKLKKLGHLQENNSVIKVTELANNILQQTGNLDIYQETFEDITKKVSLLETVKKDKEMCDMFAE